MFKSINYFLAMLMLASVMLSCKPVRKSYVPYRKRNKCGCPTYGMNPKQKSQNTFSAQSTQANSYFNN